MIMSNARKCIYARQDGTSWTVIANEAHYSWIYRNKAAVKAPNTVSNDAVTLTADPVNVAGVAEAVAVEVTLEVAVPETSEKLAHVILCLSEK